MLNKDKTTNLDELRGVFLAARGSVGSWDKKNDDSFVLEGLNHVNGNGCFGAAFFDRRELHNGAGWNGGTNSNHAERMLRFFSLATIHLKWHKEDTAKAALSGDGLSARLDAAVERKITTRCMPVDVEESCAFSGNNVSPNFSSNVGIFGRFKLGIYP